MAEIFTIPANSRISVGFPARYLFIESISVPGAEIEVRGYGDLNGEQFSFEETLSEGAGLSGFPITIDDWYLINKTGSEITVNLKAGLVYYEKNEFSGVVSGDVNASITESIDLVTKEKNKTLDGNQFCYGGGVAAVTSQTSYIALVNPAASVVNLNIERAEATSGTPPAGYGIVTEANFNALGIADAASIIEAVGFNCNKLSGGVNSTGRIHKGASAAGLVIPGFLTPKSSFDSEEASSRYAPFVIKPGYAFLFHAQVNTSVNAFMEWSEEVV